MVKRALTFVLAGGFALVWGTCPAHAASGLSLQPVATGLNYATSIANAGDGSGRLFVTTQRGRVLIVDSTGLRPTPFLDISTLTSYTTEQGLLGIAFHKNYATNHYFYVDYTDTTGKVVIARYTASAGDPNVADPASAAILMTIYHPYANHNGGQLQFGPDGYLYIGSGDGGNEGDPNNLGQNLGTWLGKMLRIDVDGGIPYAIPPTNPFHYPNAPEIWAYGLRNPWRFSFDRATGDLLIADVGQYTNEEIDFQPAHDPGGRNYGWRLMEGTECYDPPSQDALPCTPPTGLTLPVMEYRHGVADYCDAVTGGYRYRGPAIPSLAGTYLFADYCSGRVWESQRDAGGTWAFAPALDTGFNVSTFGEDEAGEVYVAAYGSGATLYKIAAGSPALSISDARVLEGDSGTTDATFTVFLLPASASEVTVGYSTLDGTGRAGIDYASTSGTLTFPAGATSTTVAVPVVGNTTHDGDRTFHIGLSVPVNATLVAVGDTGTGTIVDDDAGLSIGIAGVSEGDPGLFTNMVFTVKVSPVTTHTVTVDYATQDGTATAGSDYLEASGTLTIPAGAATATITVPVIGDDLVEGTETFTVTLSNPLNATIVGPAATGFIRDDDTGPEISLSDAAPVVEGDSGTMDVVFAVTLSRASAQTVTVAFKTFDLEAVAGLDYLPAQGILTFTPGVTSLPVTVSVLGDTLSEGVELFQLQISAPTLATVGRYWGNGTILDDDPLPVLSVVDASVLEGDQGTRNLAFPVSLSTVSGQLVSVSYVTSPQTASEAVLQTFSNATPIHHHEGVSGSPYPSVITVPTLAGPVQKVTANLIFDQFGTAGSLDVLLVGPHGQKVLLLSDVDGTTGFPAPSVTFDDDAPPLPATTTLTGSTTCAPTNYNPPGDTDAFAKPAPPPPYSNSLGVFKGLDPVGDWKLYVMRGGSVSSLYDGAIQQWFLTFQTEGDYVRTAGTLTIPAGTQTGVVVVPVIGDPLVEPDETFSLDLGTPTGATIGNGHAVGTVL